MSSNSGKDFFSSKTTWGALVYLISPALQAAGFEYDAEELVNSLTAVAGGVLFVWGMFSAKRAPIGSVAGVKVREDKNV